MANAFNSVLRGVIFQEFRVASGDIIQLIPFFHAFYAFKSFLFYSHCNCEGDITIIPFAIRIQQGDLLRGALFALTHFRDIYSTTNNFPFCLFSSIIDDIHIIGRLSIVSFAYEHFQTEFCVISFSIQPQKCITWSPSSLPPNFNTPS
jgi:hypothetical protein